MGGMIVEDAQDNRMGKAKAAISGFPGCEPGGYKNGSRQDQIGDNREGYEQAESEQFWRMLIDDFRLKPSPVSPSGYADEKGENGPVNLGKMTGRSQGAAGCGISEKPGRG